MPDQVILLVIAGLRRKDLASLPRLKARMADGDEAVLAPGFPCLSGPVQANLLTGVTPDRHGVVADLVFDRARRSIDRRQLLEERLESPPIDAILRQHDPRLVSCAVGRGAASRAKGWFETALETAKRRPDFLHLSCDELAAVAQRSGPDSVELNLALADIDRTLGELIAAVDDAYGTPSPLWLVTGGYAVSPVKSVCFPNRILRQAGLLALRDSEVGPIADLERTAAFALADRQVSHVYVANGNRPTIAKVENLLSTQAEIAEILVGDERRKFDLEHPKAGDVILISTADSWQAYPWWSDEEHAPAWTGDVGASHKLGADPLELFAANGRSPLDPALINGSHGAPARDEAQRSVILSSEPGVLAGHLLADTDVCDLVLRQFGI